MVAGASASDAVLHWHLWLHFECVCLCVCERESVCVSVHGWHAPKSKEELKESWSAALGEHKLTYRLKRRSRRHIGTSRTSSLLLCRTQVVSERERERERECVCLRERERVSVCYRVFVREFREWDSMCVCVCVRERVWERERVFEDLFSLKFLFSTWQMERRRGNSTDLDKRG